MSPHPYAFLAVFAAAAVAFPVALLGVARLWFRFIQPQKPGDGEEGSYSARGGAGAFRVGVGGVGRLGFRSTRRARRGDVKNAVYECGLAPTGDSWIQFKAHYYLYAILFLIFDVELLFLLPFAVAFTALPAGALLAMLVFILLLAEGLVWAGHRGHLEWK